MKLPRLWPSKPYRTQLAEAQRCPSTQVVHRDWEQAKRETTAKLLDEMGMDLPALRRAVG